MGIENGTFRPFNTGLMATFDLRFFNMMVDANYLVSNRIHIEEAFKEYFNMKFNGILMERDLTLLTKSQSN
jgi:hypothetical protein